MRVSVEQQARDLLERLGVEDAQEYSAGEIVELANLINEKRPPEVHIVFYGHSIVGVYWNRPDAETVAKAREAYQQQRWGDRAGVLHAEVRTYEVQREPKLEDL